MKKSITLLLLCALVLTTAACGNKEKTKDPVTPSYDAKAKLGDEGVVEREDGSIIAPSYSEEYGSSHGTITVTTPEEDGHYDVLIYHFPNHVLESIEYEMHFKDEEQAKRVYEDRLAANAENLSIEGGVVRYSDTSSRWIGYKKRDILDNHVKSWDQMGYTYVNK